MIINYKKHKIDSKIPVPAVQKDVDIHITLGKMKVGDSIPFTDEEWQLMFTAVKLKEDETEGAEFLMDANHMRVWRTK